MNFLNFYKKPLFLAIFCVLILPISVFGQEVDIANLPKPPATISVSEKGEVKVKNAVVFHIISNTLFIRTNWDNAYIRWTIRTDNNTQIIKKFDGTASLSEIKVGHILNIDGNLVTGSESMDMKATFIRDLSLENEDGSFSGTVYNSDGGGKVLTLKTKNKKDITVTMDSDTVVKKGNININPSKIKTGDIVLGVSGIYHQPSETIKAKSIEIYQDKKVFAPRNFQGKLKSLSSTNLPTNAIVTVGSIDYTVVLGEKTQVLNNKKSNTKLNRFVEGDIVRFYGSIKEGAETTVDAEIIRNLDL